MLGEIPKNPVILFEGVPYRYHSFIPSNYEGIPEIQQYSQVFNEIFRDSYMLLGIAKYSMEYLEILKD